MSSMKDKFSKKLSKKSSISLDDPTPKFWLSTGNYVINKIISGKYDRGFPQGRIGGLAGPSGSGKSFILANAIKQAQQDGYFILVIDSENALDPDYLRKIGVDTDHEDYLYVSVKNLSSCADTIHTITEDYHAARDNGTLDQMQKLLIVIDSLDFLFTDSMLDKFEDGGELGNDQGLQAKKTKQLLSTLVQDIKFLPGLILCTKQVYVDQTPHAFPPWKFTDALKFAFTQILLITRLLHRDEKSKLITGIKIKVFGFKTRNTQPYQQCEIMVPYDTGLDPYEGLLPVAVSLGVVTQAGAWYSFGEKKFQRTTGWDGVKAEVFEAIRKIDNVIIDIEVEGVEEGMTPAAVTKEKKVKLRDAVARIAEAKASRTEADDLVE